MLRATCALVLVALLLPASSSADSMVLLKPPAGASGKPQVGVVMITGAASPTKSYQPLYQKLQALVDADYALYVAIPAFYFDTPQPLQIGSKISEAQQAMKSAGLGSAAPLFVAGHSLGTVFLQSWTMSNKGSVAGQILMGGGLLRKYRNGTASTTYPVPTLTLDGTLDGLYRVTRQAETFYHYQEHAPSTTKTDFPVVLFEGANHWSFASGLPPSNVKSNDLRAEMTEDEGHAAIAGTIAQFMAVRLAGEPGFPADASGPKAALEAAVQSTGRIVGPLIAALEQEAHVHLAPPCDSDYPMPASCPDYRRYPSGAQGTKPNPAGCTCGTPWVSQRAQAILAGLDKSPVASTGVTVAAVDAIHPVSDLTPVHLPHIWNNCSSSSSDGGSGGGDSCIINVTTVTNSIYSTLDSLDTGFYPASASELRVKLKSRESVWLAAGATHVNFTATDEVPSLCAEINAQAYQWALDHAGPVAAKRFAAMGEPLTMGADSFNGNAGPVWILNSLKYNEAADKSKIEVVAPCSHTPVDYSIAQAAGFHYCKLLSPARAMEHIYIDGLRAKDHD